MSKISLFLMCSLLAFTPSWSNTNADDSNLEVRRSVPERVLQHSVWLGPEWLFGSGVGTGIAVEVGGRKAILSAEHVAAAIYPFGINVCSFGYDCIVDDGTFILDSANGLDDDWALYFVDKFPKDVKAARIAKNDLSVGDEVWSVGMAWGDSPMVVPGTIAWVHEVGGIKMYTVNGYCVPGFSGGGVFNKKGELVGVSVAITVSEMGPQENYAIVIPISQIPLLN
jgi:hypothetical protein